MIFRVQSYKNFAKLATPYITFYFYLAMVNKPFPQRIYPTPL